MGNQAKLKRTLII